jgi:hypothetical protein
MVHEEICAVAGNPSRHNKKATGRQIVMETAGGYVLREGKTVLAVRAIPNATTEMCQKQLVFI